MKKKLLSFILACMMVIGSPLAAFAETNDSSEEADQQVLMQVEGAEAESQDSMKVPEGVILAASEGEKIAVDDLENVYTEDVPEGEDVSRAIQRNWALILGNEAYPTYIDDEGNARYFSDIVISEKYTGSQFQYMPISLDQRNKAISKLLGKGHTFSGQWYVRTEMRIESANPINITYTENGEEKVWPMRNGTVIVPFISIDGDKNSVINGKFTFRDKNNNYGTSGFACGISFLYKDMTSAPASPYIVYNDPSSDYAALCGVDSSMEYQVDGGTNWTRCTSNKMPLTYTNDILRVRYSASNGNEASLDKTFLLKEPGEIPKLILDWQTGKITGLTNKMEMRFNFGAWEPISEDVFENGAASYMSLLSYGQMAPFEVRYKATESTPASYAAGWYLLPFVAPGPTDLWYNDVTNVFGGLDETMEYSVDLRNWFGVQNGTNALNLYNVLDYQQGLILYVRYKETSTTPASMYTRCDIPGLSRPAPTKVSMNYDLDKGKFMFQNLTPGTMYDISMDAFNSAFYYFTAPASGTFALVDAYAETGNQIYMRLRSTSTEGPSAMTVITVPEKDGYGVETPNSDVALQTTELDNEVFMEDADSSIEVITYDGECVDDEAETIGRWELAAPIAE